MTELELEKYLLTTELFKKEIHTNITSSLDTSSYKSFIQMLGMFEICVYITQHGEREKWVDFTLSNNNLFACHKLKDLDFSTLHKELSKIFATGNSISVSKFNKWSEIECRDYKIKEILECNVKFLNN